MTTPSDDSSKKDPSQAAGGAGEDMASGSKRPGEVLSGSGSPGSERDAVGETGGGEVLPPGGGVEPAEVTPLLAPGPDGGHEDGHDHGAEHGHDHGEEYGHDHDPYHGHDHDPYHGHDPYYDHGSDHHDDPAGRGYDPHGRYHDDRAQWEGLAGGADGGGLIDIKVFLANVERFRWFAIKSGAALVIGMVLCLVAGNRVVRFLEWPLRSVQQKVGSGESLVVMKLSDNRMSHLRMTTNEFQAMFPGFDTAVELRLGAVPYGSEQVLGFRPVPLEGRLAGKALVDLHVYDPMGAFWVAFQVAFYGGFAVASPLIFLFLGQFLLPFLGGEFVEVRSVLARWVTMAAGLFFAGMAFCYLLLLRVSLYGSVGFAKWMTFGADEWSATDYISFSSKFMVAMGIGFQVPVVILLLVRVGVLNYSKLARFRPYWVVMNLVGSAFITPDGSPVTMLLMAAPLWVLYEISVFIAWRWSRA